MGTQARIPEANPPDSHSQENILGCGSGARTPHLNLVCPGFHASG